MKFSTRFVAVLMAVAISPAFADITYSDIYVLETAFLTRVMCL